MARLTPEQVAGLSPDQVNEMYAAWQLADALLKNPETKPVVQGALKKLNPKASIPEFDIKATVDTEVGKLREEIATLKNELKAGKELDQYTAQFEKAASKYGITDDGKEKVLKLMHEEGIRSPEAGMLLFQERNPAPQPLGVSGWENQSMFDESEGSELDGWFKDPDKKRDQEIRAALTDVRKAA